MITDASRRYTKLRSHADPAQSFPEALDRLAALQAQDGAGVNPVCRTRMLGFGAKTERVIVCLHGLTSCPAQFLKLAGRFTEAGYTVLIPRLPRHGLADRMTTAMAGLSLRELLAITDEAIDIAHGLGDQVTVIGLSGGGLLAAWAGQQRPDVHHAMSISPLFWAQAISPSLQPFVRIMARLLPNRWHWSDPAAKESRPAPSYSYQRFPDKAILRCLRLAAEVLDESMRTPPAARHLTVVTNASDREVDNVFTNRLVENWRLNSRAQPDRVRAFEFEASLALPHDIIAPEQPGQNIQTVYPALVKLARR